MSPSEYPSALDNPFRLGVASGDPLPDGFVLWTRLAPDPLNGGGMDGQGDVVVDWEVTTDAGFTNTIQTSREHPTATVKARAIAEARLAHSVHLEVTGLEPGTRYYYRFIAGDYTSPVGRTKTAPGTSAEVSAMAFAFANCQSWQEGLYPAYRHMAEDEELDLVVHLGDYIYEKGPAAGGPRVYKTDAPTDLAGYRNRHAEYKTDRDLQAAHAAHPWVVTWDDHEVYNNYAGGYIRDQNAQRDAAYQAYYEHMPLRPSWALGQENWLKQNLTSSGPLWNIIANQLIMMEYDHASGSPPGSYYMDGWDGYVATRNRIFEHLVENEVPNPIVLTGDIHAAWVADLKYHRTTPTIRSSVETR